MLVSRKLVMLDVSHLKIVEERNLLRGYLQGRIDPVPVSFLTTKPLKSGFVTLYKIHSLLFFTYQCVSLYTISLVLLSIAIYLTAPIRDGIFLPKGGNFTCNVFTISKHFSPLVPITVKVAVSPWHTRWQPGKMRPSPKCMMKPESFEIGFELGFQCCYQSRII